MSIYYGALVPVMGFIAGTVTADVAELGQAPGIAVGVVGAVGLSVLWFRVLDLPAASGFGARAGPGPAPPKWVNGDQGTAIYDEDDEWRAVHYESGFEVVADDPQGAADELAEKLNQHGWIDSQ